MQKPMANISYLAPDEIADPEARQWLEESIERGRPGPENQSIRAHQPDVMRAEVGFVEHDLKELVRTYIAYSLNCDY